MDQAINPRNSKGLTSLCVFCGSRSGRDPVLAAEAKTLGTAIAAEGVTLVYGGGHTGLMGVVADAVLAGGGTVVGVIPDFLKDRELAHTKANEMIVVPDMHARKRTMFERSDAFCVLPGGIGTLEELFEIVSWRSLAVHDKPVVLANFAGYWDHLIALLDAVEHGGFAYDGLDRLIKAVDRADQILPTISSDLDAAQGRTPVAGPTLDAV